MAEEKKYEADPKETAAEETAQEVKDPAQEQETGEVAQTEAPAEEQADSAAETEESTEQEALAEEPAAEETGEAPADGSDAGAAEEKTGFFSRLKKADKEKQALKDRVAELEDRSLRQLAEFENFRKRSEREKEQRFSMGEKNVIEKILPVVDNFERGLASMPEEERGGAFASGMEMIYKQLMKQLEDLGVKPIEAVGQPFDPNFHNAVMQVESEELPSGTVAQEFQKGYLYHDSVVRYSMVGVVA